MAADTRPDAAGSTSDPRQNQQSQIHRVVDDLHARFGDQHSRDELREIVDKECGRWANVPIKDFVPIFVERSVRGQIQAERNQHRGPD